MSLFGAALETEWLKFRRARAVLIATAMLVVGVVALCSSFMIASFDEDSIMAVKLGQLLTDGGWGGFLSMASQITAVASLLAFGVVLAWLFGREFADNTAPGLFALPVSRATIALAKLAVFTGWLLCVTLAIVAAITAAGFALGLGGQIEPLALGKLAAIALLTGLLALPAALVATLSRGYLAPIGAIVGIVAISQVAAVSGLGGWFPFAAPGLWAGLSGAAAVSTVTAAQLTLVPVVGIVFAALTVRAWRRLQL